MAYSDAPFPLVVPGWFSGLPQVATLILRPFNPNVKEVPMNRGTENCQKGATVSGYRVPCPCSCMGHRGHNSSNEDILYG